MRIALIAHDRMKNAMVALATEFAPLLKQHTLMATGTTGHRLGTEVHLNVECLLSGPRGGDLQIGARLSVGEVDAIIFLRDSMTANSLWPDSKAPLSWIAPGMPALLAVVGAAGIGVSASHSPVPFERR